MSNVGYATLSIIPSLRGAEQELQRESGRFGRLGADAFSDAFRQSVDFRRALAAGDADARRAGSSMAGIISRDLRDAGDGLSVGVQGAWRDSNGRLRNALGQFIAEAEDAGAEAGGGFADQMGGGMDAGAGGAGGPAGVMAAVTGGLVLAAGAAGYQAGQKFAEELGASMERERSLDKLAASMRLNPLEVEAWGAEAAELYYGGWGENYGAVTEALTAVGSTLSTWVPVEQMDRATALAMDMGTAFEVSADQIAHSAGIMLHEGVVGSWEEAFDILTVGLAEMPYQIRDELLEASNEYTKHTKDLGWTANEIVGLLASVGDGGIYMVDKMGDSLKEFTLRATDFSATTAAAYTAIGVSGDEMRARLLAGGPDSAAAFQEIAEGLLAIEDPARRAESAIALFGTPLEDMAVGQIPEFLSLAAGMGAGLDDVGGAAQDLSDTLNDNTSTWWETIKRGFARPFEEWFDQEANPIAREFATAFAEDGFAGLGQSIRTWWPHIRSGFEDWWNQDLMPWVHDAGPKVLTGIGDGIAMAGPAAVDLWGKAAPVFGAFLIGAGEWVQNTAIPWVEASWGGWWDAITEDDGLGERAILTLSQLLWDLHEWFITDAIPWAFAKGWEWTSSLFTWLATEAGPTAISSLGWLLYDIGVWVKDHGVPGLWNAGKSMFMATGEWITGDGQVWLIGQVGSFIGGVTSWLTDDAPGLIADAARGMWVGVPESFKAHLNTVIGMWNTLELPSFTIGGWETPFGTVPSWTSPKVPLPDIPTFHTGGIVPGRRGDEVLIRALAGERVLTEAQQGERGVTVHQTINGAGDSPEVIGTISARQLGWMLASAA